MHSRGICFAAIDNITSGVCDKERNGVRFQCSKPNVSYLCVVCALHSPGVLNIALMIRNPLLWDVCSQPLALRVVLLSLIMLLWMWTSTKAFGPCSFSDAQIWRPPEGFFSHVMRSNSYWAKQRSNRALSFTGNHPPCELADCCG